MRHPTRANTAATGFLLASLLALGTVAAPGPSVADTETSSAESTATAASFGVDLRLNEMRIVGTHNSFHVHPFIAFHPRHRYQHDELTVQLERHRVRALELDLHQSRRGEYQIYHIAFIDDRSHCKAFVDCLSELREWSDSNPQHDPLLVWLEIKDYAGGVRIESVKPVDALLRRALGDRLLTPDDVRGSHATLREAIETDGWPTLTEARGRILFLMDGNAQHVADYTSGYEHVRGRVMFPGAEPHQFHMGWAGAAKINDPTRPLIAAARAVRILTTTTVCVAQLTDAECVRSRDIALRSSVNVLMDDFVHRVPGRDYYLDLRNTTLAER